MELILKIVTGTNGRYYVTERGVVIYTTHNWYDAWDFIAVASYSYRSRTS